MKYEELKKQVLGEYLEYVEEYNGYLYMDFLGKDNKFIKQEKDPDGFNNYRVVGDEEEMHRHLIEMNLHEYENLIYDVAFTEGSLSMLRYLKEKGVLEE